MGLDNEKREILDQAWIDSLLVVSMSPNMDQSDETRIANLWRRIEIDSNTPNRVDADSENSERAPHTSLLAHPNEPTNRPRSKWRSVLAVACVIALLSAIPWLLRPSHAIAAIDRANQVFPTPRKYRIQMANIGENASSRTVWLYLDSSNRYVVEHPSWFQSQRTWLGGDSRSQWIVPPVGPAFTGNQRILNGWLIRRDSDTPYLHLSTILDRMRNGYELTRPKSTELSSSDNQRTIDCEYIIGTRRLNRPGLPATIELWTQRDSGMAQRVVLQWGVQSKSSDGSMQKRWTIDLVDSPKLPSDWFSLEGHLRPSQRTIEVFSSNDLENIEVENAQINRSSNNP